MRQLLLLLFTTITSVLVAQNQQPVYDYEKHGVDVQASQLYLESDKSIVELNETFNVKIIMVLASKEDYAPYTFNYRYKDPSDAPWTVGEFKIISGGGKIVLKENEVAQLVAPSTMPKEKAMLIQVTLIPRLKQYQQVQLLTTVYLADNDNVFYFDCPALNIKQEKYIVKQNSGANMTISNPTQHDAKTLNESVDAHQKEALRKLQAKNAAAVMEKKGYDLSALTSNCKAVYSKEENTTVITIQGDSVAMMAGNLVRMKRPFLITCSFTGNSTGRFPLKLVKQNTIAITFPMMMKACSCADDPEEKKRRDEAGEKGPTCDGGAVVITDYNPKEGFVKGYFLGSLEGADEKGTIFYGRLHGKFKVALANFNQ